MKQEKRTGKKVGGSLVALSSAAILSIYVAGYARTQGAAESVTVVDSPVVVVARSTDAPGASLAFGATPTPVVKAPITSPSATSPAQAGGTIADALEASPTATAANTGAEGGYRDGTYVGLGRSRFGSVEATVVVEAGHVVSAEITRCTTSYPCSKIAALPGQVVERQSDQVDLVSGATFSSRAYQTAIARALAQAS